MSTFPKIGGSQSAVLRHETILLLVLAVEWFYFTAIP